MENVVLIIHLILAFALIGIVLLQRNEGGMGGLGGGSSSVMTGRAAATALGKLTWALAIGFIATSIALTIIAAKNAAGDSVFNGLDTEAPAAEAPAPAPTPAPAPATGSGDLLPPAPPPATPATTPATPATPAPSQ